MGYTRNKVNSREKSDDSLDDYYAGAQRPMQPQKEPTRSNTEMIASPPEPTYASDPKVLKLLVQSEPLDCPGTVEIPKDRSVVWKNLCMIGPHHIECIVEFSMTKTKFFILTIDLYSGKYHTIELFNQQAQKLLKACDKDLEKLMKMLDFKMGKLYIKHQEMLLNYETYMGKSSPSRLSNAPKP